MRINRRLRRVQQPLGKLTVFQEEMLRFGQNILDIMDAGFSDEGHMRAAWAEHRKQLIASAGPGRRPWAFYRFELGCERPSAGAPDEELKLLLERGLISKSELAAVRRAAQVPPVDAKLLTVLAGGEPTEN